MNSVVPPTLPVELYRPIVQHLTSLHDLHPLLLVSKAFSAEVELILYHTITLQAVPENNGDINLVEHLASSPRLASLVQRLDIPNVSLRLVRLRYKPYWNEVHRALKNMINLQHLHIDNSLSFAHTEPAIDVGDHTCLLEGCTFRLRSLVLQSIHQKHLHLIEAHAPYLEELIFFYPLRGASQLTEGVQFPKVKTAGCVAADLPYILTRMPNIRAMQWTGGIGHSEWGPLEPFQRIRMLNIHCYTSLAIIRPIVSSFSSLVYLKCMMLIKDPDAMFSAADFLEIPSRVGTLRTLKKLCLEMEHQKYREGMLSPFAALFGPFPSLLAIELHVEDGHIGLRKGTGGDMVEYETRHQQSEWKDDIWLEGG